jgi:hypothetical protein
MMDGEDVDFFEFVDDLDLEVVGNHVDGAKFALVVAFGALGKQS